jgi:hypothetical protein
VIDALLYAVRDAVQGAGLGYDYATCEVRDDGHPPPRCGDIFVAVHQNGLRGDMHNALNQYFGFDLTLTMRVTVPLDRVGDRLLAKKLARERGFNRRVQELGIFLHMDWGVLQDANQLLVAMNPDATLVYGFCEPAAWENTDDPTLVGGEWFAAEPDAEDVGLIAALHFANARRLQAIAVYT